MALSKITTESLLDGEITLPKLSSGTDGNIISYDASGNPVAIATGNDGQVLTSTGAGSPPAFEDAAAGGSWTLIATAVASDSASLTITGLNSTYDTYAILMSDLVPASDGQIPNLRLGDSSGVDTGSNDYSHLHMGDRVDSASFSLLGMMDDTYDRVPLCANGAGNAAGEGFGGTLYLHRPQDGTVYPMISGHMIIINNSSNLCVDFVGASRNSAIDVDRVNLYMASGNIATGRMSVWGIAHA